MFRWPDLLRKALCRNREWTHRREESNCHVHGHHGSAGVAATLGCIKNNKHIESLVVLCKCVVIILCIPMHDVSNGLQATAVILMQ